MEEYTTTNCSSNETVAFGVDYEELTNANLYGMIQLTRQRISKLDIHADNIKAKINFAYGFGFGIWVAILTYLVFR